MWRHKTAFALAEVSSQSWIDPTLAPAAVSGENIAKALQAQYEPWQARARVRIVVKPTNDELKRLCLTLRRHAKVWRPRGSVSCGHC